VTTPSTTMVYRHALLYLGGNPGDDRPTVMFDFGKAGKDEQDIENTLRAEAWERGYTDYGTFLYTPVRSGDTNAH
jgi:hypothetical protein